MKQTFEQKLLLVMQAQCTNRAVQYRSSLSGSWTDDKTPNVHRWKTFEYRIKPEEDGNGANT